MNIRAISPIVATIVLVGVAILSLFSFQGWFDDYITQLNTNIENVERIPPPVIEQSIGNHFFLRYEGEKKLSVKNITVDGERCSKRMNLTTGVQSFQLDECVNGKGSSRVEVVFYTSEGIFTQNTFIRGSVNELSFTPTQLDNLTIWLDAADETTISSSGGIISSWDDKSGMGNNAIQSDSWRRPEYVSNSLNAKPTVDFDGNNDRLRIPHDPSFDINDTGTGVILIVPRTVKASGSGYPGVFSKGGSSNRQMWLWQVQETEKLGAQFGTNNLQSGGVPGAYTEDEPSLVILMGSMSQGTQELYVNGELLKQSSTSPATKQFSPFYLAYIDSYDHINGSFAEFLFFNRNISSWERQQLEGYLAHKWDMETKLPSVHPYRNQKP